MKKLTKFLAGSAVAMCAIFVAGSSFKADACSRIIYEGTDSLIIIGRSLDWKNPIPTNVYVYPRGMYKMGSDKPGAITWTSKYGAVYAVGYDAGVTEGMNEKGLSVNGLFCRSAIYVNDTNDNRPPMSLAMFPAWILDLCATTQEAIDLLKSQDFSLSGATFDGGTTSTLHWGITDAQGNSAVIEFDSGDINIYKVDSMRAMTNEPGWPAMKAIVKYWENIGGHNMLPGSVSSPDRCVRGNYFVTHVKKVGEADLGASICRTALFNICVPFEYFVPGEDPVPMTQWRSFSNLRDHRYYFDLVTGSGFYYIDLDKCDLRPGASVLKITTSEMNDACGDQTKALKKVKPFTPMY